MSVVKTISFSKTPLSCGNVQLQSDPLTSSDAANVLSSGGVATVVLSDSSAFQANISPKCYIKDTTSNMYTTSKSLSFSGVVQNIKDGIQVVSSVSTSNVVLPSVGSLSSNTAGIKTQLSLVSPTNKVSDFELKTGFSVTRPEILFLSYFLPIVDDSGNPTSTARYMTSRNQLSSIKTYSVVSTLSTSSNIIANISNVKLSSSSPIIKQFLNVKLNTASSGVKPTVSKTQIQFDPSNMIDSVSSSVDKMVSSINFLVQAESLADDIKTRLDMKSVADPVVQTPLISTCLYPYIKNFGPQSVQQSIDQFVMYVKSPKIEMNESFTAPDYLVSCGFTQPNIQQWTSSRVWTQMVHEVGRQLLYVGVHSDVIVSSTSFSSAKSVYSNDSDATSTNLTFHIDQTQNPFNSLVKSGFYNSSIKSVSTQSLSSPDVGQWKSVSDLSDQFSKNFFTLNRPNGSVSKIPIILDLLSKEYRYSKFFSSEKSILAGVFSNPTFLQNLPSSTNNFSSLASYFSVDSSDVFNLTPSTLSSTSFSDITTSFNFNQKTNRYDQVSLFEPVKINDQNVSVKNIIPGGEFYIDQVFDITNTSNFDVKNLSSLSSMLDDKLSQLMTFVSEANLLLLDEQNGCGIESPSTLIRLITDQLVDSSGHPTKFMYNM